MNSSGIKRGLAGSAVAALAVTGLPFFASSADAAAGDTMTVVSTGPARNGGDLGADVVIRVKDGTVTPANLKLTSTTSATAGSQNTSDQSATILGADAPVNDSSDSAYETITVHIAVTTSTTGDSATFRIFEDEPVANNTLDAAEPRANVSVSTAGAASALTVTPSNQTTAQGIESGDYTVTVKDAQGRTTQLQSAEAIAVTSDGDITVNESGGSITAAEISDGTDTFTATPSGAAALNSHTITLDGPGSVDTTATLTVSPAANISSANMVDIVTGADSWDGFGGGTLGGTTSVRVDQSSIRIDIKGSTAGGTVSLNVDGDAGNTLGATDVTFGGKKSTTVTTVLDADGNGSLTITPDALSVQDGDLVDISGSFNQTLSFERSAPSSIEAGQDPYFGQRGGSVDVTVTVMDQFGDPVTSGFVGAQRVAGPNAAGDPQQAKPVGADGTATFTFGDTKATDANQVDTVAFGYVKDQFQDPSTASPTGSTTIKWTATGQGADFVTSIGGTSTESPTYDPAKETVVPLADAKDDEAGEDLALAVSGVENNATVTISVDNGALILAPGKTDLSDGKSSVDVTLVGSNLPAGYRLVGTKSGEVTVTTSATNRTETAKFTVSSQVDKSTARNVTVSGPATVPNGTTQIPFVAVVTDAFGNPVANVPVTDLNVQVAGPAQFQDSDAVTNANGELHLNVRVDAGASGDVTIKVQGFGEQFGAQADRLTSSSTTDDAKGLPVSSNVGTATTTVEAAAVEKASIHLSLSGHSKGKKKDVVKANADDNAAGLTAVLYRNGKQVKSHALNDNGDWTFTVKDKNGNKKTKYQVKVASTDTTKAGKRSIRLK